MRQLIASEIDPTWSSRLGKTKVELQPSEPMYIRKLPLMLRFSDEANYKMLKKTSINLPSLALHQSEMGKISMDMPQQSEKQLNGLNTFRSNVSKETFHWTI